VRENQVQIYLIIGLGSIGRRHLGNLRKIDRQAKIIVLRHKSINKNTKDINTVEVNSIEDALSYKPTVAIIASPAVFHIKQSLALLQCGIHLFIEKPLSHNLNGIESLQRIAKEKSLVVMVGYVLRFSLALNKVKSLLESGVLGSIVNVSAHCGQYLPDWRPGFNYRKTVSAKKELGGGVLLELSHEFDYLRWLFGDVDSVMSSVTNTNSLEIDTEDKVDALLRFDQGLIGAVHLNFLEKKANRVLRINGFNGSISCDLINGKIGINTTDNIEVIDLSEEGSDMYLEELSSFLNCVKFKRTPLVTLDDGVQAVKVVEAIKQSSNNKQWVKV